MLAGAARAGASGAAPSPWRAWLRRDRPRRADDAPPAEQVAAQLTELDAALLRFGAAANRRVEHPVGVDAGRWFAAAGDALATPLEIPDAPAHPLRVRCADLADALAALRRGDGAMLESLRLARQRGRGRRSRSWRPKRRRCGSRRAR